MVTIRYDDGTGDPVELHPADNEFEYIPAGDYWAVKVGEEGDDEMVKWIPSARVYEIEGRRSRIGAGHP